jgi:hypothetical protein
VRAVVSVQAVISMAFPPQVGFAGRITPARSPL